MNEERQKIYQEIVSTLSKRQNWEKRQTLFYQMRHQGLARKTKPYPNAPDLHFPLIDSNVDKLKPIYYQQIFGFDTAATFVPMQAQLSAWTSQCERWFDYKLREQTNLQQEALTWIDNILTFSCRTVMKCRWDENKKQVVFDAIDPFKFIAPMTAECAYDSDWLVHVMEFTKNSFRRSGLFDKISDDKLEEITGKGSGGDAGQTAQEQEKYRREGLTHNESGEKIIVWELHQFLSDGRRVVEWFSPVRPEINLKSKIELPYEHKDSCFVDAAYEVKDKGWYSSRAIPEILAPFEMSLDALWNGKHETIDFYNRPTYKSERDMGNTLNLRGRPGDILPYGVVPVQMAQPPISYDQEMVNTRSVAEQRVGNPDYAMGQTINTSDRRTKYEVESVNAQSQQGYDLRIRLFRMALKRLYKQAWSLYLQFDRESLQYQFLGEMAQLPPEAMHDKYYIEPKGGLDMVSRQGRFKELVQLKQLTMQSPWVDQSQIDKQLLNLSDPSLVPLIFHDPMRKQQEAQETAQIRLPAVSMGQRLPVKPGEDYRIEIQTIMAKVQEWAQTGQQLPPEGNQAIIVRLQDLLAAYKQVDNNGGKQMEKEIAMFFQQAAAQTNGSPVTNGVPQREMQPAGMQ